MRSYQCPFCLSSNLRGIGPIFEIGPNTLVCTNCDAMAKCIGDNYNQQHWGKTWEIIDHLIKESYQRQKKK